MNANIQLAIKYFLSLKFNKNFLKINLKGVLEKVYNMGNTGVTKCLWVLLAQIYGKLNVDI